MLLVMAFGLLSVVLVAVVRLVEAERVDDRRRVSRAVPVNQYCGYAPGGPISDPSSW